MSKRFLSFLLLVLFFSSSFFIGGIEEAEAKVCMMGEYPKNSGYKVKYATDKDGNSYVQNFELKWECKPSEKQRAASEKEVTSNPKGIEKYVLYLANVVKALSGLSFGIASLVIVYAGYLYTTSEGDSKLLQRAKMMIIYSFGGIMISLFTFVLYRILVATILQGPDATFNDVNVPIPGSDSD